MSEQIKKLRDILTNAQSAVFFGGAGVSTESGIPDFRSETGLFTAREEYGLPPEELVSHSFFVEHPDRFFRYYLENMVYPSAEPNAAHRALARLEGHGQLQCVITQNIDGLHQLAGSRNVLELHGSVHRNYCLACGEKHDLGYILDAKNRRGWIPFCKKCGGIVRPDVVLYEESLSGEVLRGAARAISEADVMIVGGTSLAVYPAAGLLEYFSGRHLVLINRSATAFDPRATLVIADYIGKVLPEAVDD